MARRRSSREFFDRKLLAARSSSGTRWVCGFLIVSLLAAQAACLLSDQPLASGDGSSLAETRLNPWDTAANPPLAERAVETDVCAKRAHSIDLALNQVFDFQRDWSTYRDHSSAWGAAASHAATLIDLHVRLQI